MVMQHKEIWEGEDSLCWKEACNVAWQDMQNTLLLNKMKDMQELVKE